MTLKDELREIRARMPAGWRATDMMDILLRRLEEESTPMKFVVRGCKYHTGRLYIETDEGRFIGSIAPEGPLWADREKMASLMCDALNKQQTTGEK